MVDNSHLKCVVEAALLASPQPLSLKRLQALFASGERPDNQALLKAIEQLQSECDNRGVELKEVANGFRYQVREAYSDWVNRLWEQRPPRYSKALLEVLALIIYRQPITRGQIEELRGVGVSNSIMRTLLDREWIRSVGRRDVPGRPVLFATTATLLDDLGVKSLDELPPLPDVTALSSGAEDLTQMQLSEVPDSLSTAPVTVVREDEVEKT